MVCPQELNLLTHDIERKGRHDHELPDDHASK